LRIWSFADWETVDENGVPPVSKIPSKPSYTANDEIFNGHRLLLIQKPLTKTKSLRIKKSPKKPSSTADTEIFNGHRLLLTHKPLTETASLGPKNHQWSALLRLTLTSSTHIDYCWLRNRWRKLIPCCPKNNLRNPVPTANAEIFNGHRLLLSQKPLTRTESLRIKKSPKKPSSTTDAEIFNGHRLLLTHKPLTETASLGPKNHQWSALLRLMLTSSTHIDYCWLRKRWRKLIPCCPKNNPRNPVPTANAEIFNGHRLLLTQKPLTRIESLEPKNHPRSALLPLKLTSSTYIDYCWLRNRWWKWVPTVPKIILET
jgi:hypothetical protein